MNVLLTHGYFIAEDEKEQKIVKPYPPLGILYISAWLDRHNIENEVFDTTFSSKKDFKSFVIEFEPDVFAIYTNLMTKLNVLEIMQFVKKNLPETIVVIGGPDVRYNTENYLNAGSDIAVIGEGEDTFKEIVKSVKAGNKDEFGHIDGIAYFSEGTLITTKERSRIRPVDDLPHPNRHKIDMHKYLDIWKRHHGQSAMTMSTQRGCPYTCKWCSTAVYGQSYRRRSPDVVAAEMKAIKQTYNPDTIWFVDDVFTVSHKWIEEFSVEVKKQNAQIPFECITRADRMNPDVVKWLKEAGCFRVWIGAESGSQKVIDLMDRRVNVHQVRNMIQLSNQEGIETGTFIMLGYPGENEDDIKETVKHLKESNPDYFTITVAYPIKGTSLYNEIESIQTNNVDWMLSTDRERDFKRAYSKKYYKYAVKWVDNEVRYYQAKLKSAPLKNQMKLKLKSMASRSAMRIFK